MLTKTGEPDTPKEGDSDDSGVRSPENLAEQLEGLRGRNPNDSIVTEVRVRKVRRTAGDLNQMQKIFNGCAHFGKEQLETLSALGVSQDTLVEKIEAIDILDGTNKAAYGRMKIDIDRHNEERQKQEFHDYTEGILTRCSDVDKLIADARTAAFQSETSFAHYKNIFGAHFNYAIKEIDGSKDNGTRKTGLGLGNRKDEFLGRLQQISAVVEAVDKSATTEYAIYFAERSEEIYAVIQAARQERANILSERFRNSFAQSEPAATGAEEPAGDNILVPKRGAPEAELTPEQIEIVEYYEWEQMYEKRIKFFGENVVARIEQEEIDVSNIDSEILYASPTVIETFTPAGAVTEPGALEGEGSDDGSVPGVLDDGDEFGPDDGDGDATATVIIEEENLGEPGDIGEDPDGGVVNEDDLAAAFMVEDEEELGEQPGDIGVNEDGSSATPGDFAEEIVFDDDPGLDDSEDEEEDPAEFFGFNDGEEESPPTGDPTPPRGTPTGEGFPRVGGDILAEQERRDQELKDRENKGFYTGIKVATVAALTSGVTGFVLGAVLFSGGGEDLPEMDIDVDGNEAVHAVKANVPATKGDPAAYIRSKLDELETIAEDNEELREDYNTVDKEYKALQTDYDKEVAEVEKLQRKLRALGAEKTAERRGLQINITNLESHLEAHKQTITALQERKEELSAKLDAFLGVYSMGAYFKTGVSKSDIERFFGETTRETINRYTHENYLIFKTEEGLKIVTASGKTKIVEAPKDFDKGLKKAKARMFAIDKDLDAYVKKNGSIAIKFTGLDIYADIHRTVYKGTKLAEPTRKQARDMRRVVEEKMDAEYIKKLAYALEPGDEVELGK
ncbi:MAG: hypothetical protein KAT43_05765 [Nanoarchaeota archaeon]|nr:hypothetical protein [Nanoarchaeota archaeon]